jgi:hypothetical protein
VVDQAGGNIGYNPSRGRQDRVKHWLAIHHMVDRAVRSIVLNSIVLQTGPGTLGMHCIAGQARLGGVYTVIPIYPCHMHSWGKGGGGESLSSTRAHITSGVSSQMPHS